MTRLWPLAAAAAAVGCAVATQLSLPGAVAVLVAVPLVLVLPGLTLLAALGASEVGGAHRLVLVPSLSIAVGIVVALLVNFVHSGLTARSWAAGLAIAAVGTAVVAMARGTSSERSPSQAPALRIRWIDLFVFALAAVVVGGVIVLARTPVGAKRAQGYTILSLVRSPKSTVTIDVQSGELQERRYRLLVAGNHVVYRNTTFRLAPGARLSKHVAIPKGEIAVEATLYLGGNKRPYRHVYLR